MLPLLVRKWSFDIREAIKDLDCAKTAPLAILAPSKMRFDGTRAVGVTDKHELTLTRTGTQIPRQSDQCRNGNYGYFSQSLSSIFDGKPPHRFYLFRA